MTAAVQREPWTLASRRVKKLYPSEALIQCQGQAIRAMVDQISTADKQRMKSRIGKVTKQELRAVEHAIKVQLGLPL